MLLAALAAFIVWLARLGKTDQQEFDVFFAQSVSGLAKGSQVSYAGVPVGQVSDIALSLDDPEFVRVRISVKDNVPIRLGTTATIQASFTGVSTILLDGARKDTPLISCETTACPEGYPVIPPKAGGFGALLANAPLLLERLATLSERLNQLLSDQNQQEISGVLSNTNRLSGELADRAPEISETLDELNATLAQGRQTLTAFEELSRSTDGVINREAAAISDKLRKTLDQAGAAAETLSKSLDGVEPATSQLTNKTLPAAEATLRDLQETSEALRQVTERVSRDGATSIISSPQLPDYEPE